MRLKYEPGINGKIVIRLKEEPATYYDECTLDKLGNFVQRLSAYYSGKGELVEIKIDTGDLEKGELLFSLHEGIEKLEEILNKCILPVELKKGFEKNNIQKPFPLSDNVTVTKEEKDKWVITDLEKFIVKKEYGKLKIYEDQREHEREAMIPDIFPARRYVFLYGKEEGEPKGCVDSFTEICDSDDCFSATECLTMWRVDGKEMNEHEIWELRKDFIEDVFEYLDPEEWFVESVYWDKKLYFWKEVGDEEPYDLLNRAEVIIEKFFPGVFEELLIERKERKMGVDFIITEPVEKELNFCVDFNEIFHTNFSGKEVTLICIYDEEETEFENEITIEKDELVEICRKTDEYENRMIILDDYIQLSEEAIEYTKRWNITIQKVKEIIKMRYIKTSEWNDKDPELFEDIYAEIFGEDRGT